MPLVQLRSVAVIAAAGMVMACNESVAPDPLDLDDVLDEVTTVEAYATGLASTFGGPALPSLGAPSGAGCDYVAASRSFVCPPITTAGLTLARSFQLLDASGTAQPAFDPATTTAVKTIMHMTGTQTLGTIGTSEVLHHSEQTVGGLLGTTWTIDGESSTRFIQTSSLGTDTIGIATETDLSLPRPANGQRVYPTGTIRNVFSSSDFPMGEEFSTTTTFDGTATALIAVSFGPFTTTCTLNLAQANQPPTCQPSSDTVTSR